MSGREDFQFAADWDSNQPTVLIVGIAWKVEQVQHRFRSATIAQGFSGVLHQSKALDVRNVWKVVEY